MLKGMVYFQYVRDQANVDSEHGPVTNNHENSVRTKGAARGMVQRYNQSIKTYRAIRWYICENDDIYPEENSQFKDFVSLI